MSRALRALLCTESQRSWTVTLVLAAVVAAMSLYATSAVVFRGAPALKPNDEHSLRSLELATNWALCGKYSIAFEGDTFAAFLAMFPGSETIALRDLPGLIAGSAERYCARVDQPWRNNENSLMLAMAAALRIMPAASLADLGYALRAIRLALVAFMLIVLLKSGVSAWLAGGVAYGAIVATAAVEETRFYSVYPFLPVLLAGFVALLMLPIARRMHLRPRAFAIVSTIIGLAAATAANFRSSYLPILFGCFVLAVLIATIDRRHHAPEQRRRTIAVASLQLVSFGLGFVIFHAAFTWPIDRLPATRNLSYHVIAHPIVLGLALPPNALSLREGIEWNDRVGLDLARRVDPAVTEINRRYEDALFTYYWGLWRQYPREMARLYWAKLRLAGADIPKYSVPPVTGTFFTTALWPVSLVPDGALRTGLFFVLVLGPLFFVRRLGPALCALIAMTSLTALLLTIETALILTYFYITHEASALVFAIAVGLMVYQAAIDGVAAVAARLLQSGRLRQPAESAS